MIGWEFWEVKNIRYLEKCCFLNKAMTLDSLHSFLPMDTEDFFAKEPLSKSAQMSEYDKPNFIDFPSDNNDSYMKRICCFLGRLDSP